jgi:hypothetical protein
MKLCILAIPATLGIIFFIQLNEAGGVPYNKSKETGGLLRFTKSFSKKN